MIMNETRTRSRTGIGTREIVDVIEAVGDVGGDLHPRGPRDKIGEAGIPAVTEAVGDAGAGNKFVDEEDDGAGDGGTEEFDEAAVVAPADHGEAAAELREVHLLAEVAARNNNISVAD